MKAKAASERTDAQTPKSVSAHTRGAEGGAGCALPHP